MLHSVTATISRGIKATRMLAHGRPRCLSLVRSLVQEKRGIEIGGPSALFRNVYNLPIYDYFASLDNCDFSKETTWAKHQESFRFSKRRPCGKTFFAEGSDLKAIATGEYDVLLSSHNLEHFANPVKALREWQRIVKPGGYFLIVLPHYRFTFDHRRTPTSVEHMLQDYKQNMGEDDQTHVEETFQAHRLNPQTQTEEQLHAVLMGNFSHRMLHHHVFEEDNSRALLEAAGLKVLAVEMQLPFHLFLLAQSAVGSAPQVAIAHHQPHPLTTNH